MRLITNTLSIDSAFSMKKPVRYCIPGPAPLAAQTHAPNSKATLR
jgi:hypothetical protein